MSNRVRLEDSSSQAGWMFADLFLALTVIFLATVSFVPNGVEQQVNSNPSQKLTSSNSADNLTTSKKDIILISSGFIGEYRIDSAEVFKQDLLEYFKLKDLPKETTAIYLEVIGHTDESGAKNDAGNLDGLKFVIQARKLLPMNLKNTTTSINLSPDVLPNNVRVKVTFI